MADIPNYKPVVERVRSAYPTPLGEVHGPFLLELARLIGQGAGLLRKDWGTFIRLPDGVAVAQDIICFPSGRIFDCLEDGEGAAKPAWSEALGSPVDPTRYYLVSGVPQPDPPKPEPSADELEQVWTMIHQLQRGLSDLTEVVATRCNANVDAIQQAVNKAANMEQRLNRLKVKGRTGVRFTHSHDIDLSVSSD